MDNSELIQKLNEAKEGNVILRKEYLNASNLSVRVMRMAADLLEQLDDECLELFHKMERAASLKEGIQEELNKIEISNIKLEKDIEATNTRINETIIAIATVEERHKLSSAELNTASLSKMY